MIDVLTNVIAVMSYDSYISKAEKKKKEQLAGVGGETKWKDTNKYIGILIDTNKYIYF